MRVNSETVTEAATQLASTYKEWDESEAPFSRRSVKLQIGDLELGLEIDHTLPENFREHGIPSFHKGAIYDFGSTSCCYATYTIRNGAMEDLVAFLNAIDDGKSYYWVKAEDITCCMRSHKEGDVLVGRSSKTLFKEILLANPRMIFWEGSMEALKEEWPRVDRRIALHKEALSSGEKPSRVDLNVDEMLRIVKRVPSGGYVRL